MRPIIMRFPSRNVFHQNKYQAFDSVIGSWRLVCWGLLKLLSGFLRHTEELTKDQDQSSFKASNITHMLDIFNAQFMQFPADSFSESGFCQT